MGKKYFRGKITTGVRRKMFETDGYSALCYFLVKSTTAEVSHKF